MQLKVENEQRKCVSDVMIFFILILGVCHDFYIKNDYCVYQPVSMLLFQIEHPVHFTFFMKTKSQVEIS